MFKLMGTLLLIIHVRCNEPAADLKSCQLGYILRRIMKVVYNWDVDFKKVH